MKKKLNKLRIESSRSEEQEIQTDVSESTVSEEIPTELLQKHTVEETV